MTIPMQPREPFSPEQSFAALTPSDPRMRAALCYAFPLLPACYLLWRERRNGLVRLHAAQSIIFFGALGLAQIVLYAALVALGNWSATGAWLTALALLFWALFLALGLGGFILWLRLLNDCAHGRVRRRPLLTFLAVRLDAVALRFTRSASAAYHERRNTPPNGAV